MRASIPSPVTAETAKKDKPRFSKARLKSSAIARTSVRSI
jgi:hypothetical protein